LKSITFHIDHYTVHNPRGGKFTVGVVEPCLDTDRIPHTRNVQPAIHQTALTYHHTKG